MPHTYSGEDEWVEIFHTGSTPEVLRILEVVLRPAGVEAVIHDRVDHTFPAPASQPGTLSIAVRRRQKALAEKLIREDQSQ
jgi:hypothetical protein